jgi:hypothetical protein
VGAREEGADAHVGRLDDNRRRAARRPPLSGYRSPRSGPAKSPPLLFDFGEQSVRPAG